MNTLVQYVCRAKDHQQLALFEANAAWAPNPMTFYEGRWAYCPAGKSEGHDWQPIEGQKFEELRDRTEAEIRQS